MCLHEKKYEFGIVLTSFPCRRQWICKKCGEKGYDIENNSDFKKFSEKFILKNQTVD